MASAVQLLRRITVVMALCVALVGLTPNTANARVFVGFGIPFYGPGFYPPPYYYPPPPVYYPPPPVVYAPPPQAYIPPAQQAVGARPGEGQACYAGAYVCPMDRPAASGASCYCLGNGGQRVWGRTN